MSWVEKGQPIPFDETPIDGLFYLDGDVLAAYVGRDWTKGQKYAMIEFPSGVQCDIWETGDPKRVGVIHLFGEMDLPLGDTVDNAYQQANDIAEACGYAVSKSGENGLEVWGHDTDDHFVVIYDRHAGKMADVVPVKDSKPRQVPELLPDNMRDQLPKLYANETLGLDAQAVVKFFSADSGWVWYASEYDGEEVFFGLVIGYEIELGYFGLSELREARGPLGLPIERDRFFEPKTLRELQEEHLKQRRGS